MCRAFQPRDLPGGVSSTAPQPLTLAGEDYAVTRRVE